MRAIWTSILLLLCAVTAAGCAGRSERRAATHFQEQRQRCLVIAAQTEPEHWQCRIDQAQADRVTARYRYADVVRVTAAKGRLLAEQLASGRMTKGEFNAHLQILVMEEQQQLYGRRQADADREAARWNAAMQSIRDSQPKTCFGDGRSFTCY